ncbi:MAG: hypothetical protein KY456_11540 [Chloroflexi bacterium]|nr:hypothetical protein [Chloroflexota bacterium]
MHVHQSATMTPCRKRRGSLLAAAISIVATALVTMAGTALAHEEHGHPTRIHEGSCEDLGAVGFRLNGVGGSVDLDDTPIATATPVNPDSAYQVLVSETTIDATIDDVLAAEHAVMIYESDDVMDAIACGNVGGAMHGDTLFTALAEAGVPGHSGFALFRSEGAQTVVTVILGHGLAPVSASGASEGHDEEDEDDAVHEHTDGGENSGHDHVGEEDGSHAMATPEA